MRLAYVGPYLSTAPGSAALQRALGVSRSLVEAGSEVTVLATDGGEPEPVTGVTIERSPQRAGSSPLAKARELVDHGRRTTGWLDARRDHVDGVLLYGGGSLFAGQVLRWCRSAGVPAVVDAVEWHDRRHQPLGPYGPVALDLERAMRRTYRRSGNVIVISRYLERHFAAQGCRTVRVPPTTDVAAIPWSATTPAGPLRMAYAGTPGRKDLLDVVLAGLRLADPEGTRCHLDVVGPPPGQWSDPRVTAHGRLPRSAVLEIVGRADFVPLLRPDARYANAGFPTKVVESMTVGTPVICNLTSDLGEHVRDGSTGLVAAQPTPEAFAAAVRRALDLTADERTRMRAAARAEAERAFDYRAYAAPLGAFLAEAAGSAAGGGR